MNEKIRKHLNDAADYKNKIIESELKAIESALQIFEVIKSFKLEYVEQSNDEGGYSRQYLIKSINDYPIKVYTEYIEEDFINDTIKKMLFESKNTESVYTQELETLCHIVNEIGEDSGDKIAFKKTINLTMLSQILQKK